MKMRLMRAAIGSVFCVLGLANLAAANVDVGVDVSAPNVRVQVGTPVPPSPPRLTVVERERVIIRESEERHDRGKHKGHHKKHKKHKKH